MHKILISDMNVTEVVNSGELLQRSPTRSLLLSDIPIQMLHAFIIAPVFATCPACINPP